MTTQPLPRLFKVGAVQVYEDETTRALTVEDVRALLAAQYPEVKHALVRERDADGYHVVEFLPQPGRKG